MVLPGPLQLGQEACESKGGLSMSGLEHPVVSFSVLGLQHHMVYYYKRQLKRERLRWDHVYSQQCLCHPCVHMVKMPTSENGVRFLIS